MPNSRNYILNSELQYMTLRDPTLQKRFKDGRMRAMNTLPLPGQSLQEQYPILSRQFIKMLDENMSNLRPMDLKPSSPHRAIWVCTTCGKQFTSAIKLVVNHGECICQSCKSKRYMKNLKERNKRIRAEIREQERKQREEHKKSKEHKKS